LQILKFPQKICGQKAAEVFQRKMGLEEKSIYHKWLIEIEALNFFFLTKKILEKVLN